MNFISSAVSTLEVIVIALGAGLSVWCVVNLMEGYGGDNAAANGRVHKEATASHKKTR